MTDALTNAILAMDAYNRGYDPKLSLTDATVNQGKIGFANIVGQDDSQDAQDVSFYAIAYEIDDQLVISYRGTDAPSGAVGQSWLNGDVFNGWVVGGGIISDQAIRAFRFYQLMSNYQISGQDYASANISLTGHSLGGGLAGLVGSIYGKSAVVFDNMPFESAAQVLYAQTSQFSSIADAVYGTGNSPSAINASLISGYAVAGEVLESLRSISSFQPTVLSTHGPWDFVNPFQLHSQSLLTVLLYGETLPDSTWQNSAEYFISKISDSDIANALGWTSADSTGLAESGDKMSMALAYSALDISSNPSDGVLVYGDTAIRSLFDDAGDLGSAIVRVSGDPTGVSAAFDEDTKDLIGSIITNYAGALAYEQIARFGTSGQPDRVDGILAFHDAKGSLSLNLKASYWEFGGGEHGIMSKQNLLTHLFDASGVNTNIDVALVWYSGSSAIASDLIDTVTFDLNGSSDEVDGFVSLEGLNLVLTRENVGGGWVIGSGDYLLIGSSAGENIIGGSGRDIIFGGDGVDTLTGGEGDDWLDGGEGEDVADYSAGARPIRISVSYGDLTVRDGNGGTDELIGIETIKGTAGRDLLSVKGTIFAGDDQITIDANGGQSPNPRDTIDISGLGSDSTVYIDSAGSGAITDLSTGAFINLRNFHTGLIGSWYNDTITDHATGAKRIDGGWGADVVTVTNGPATVYGGYGDDILTGGVGNDILVGGHGDDSLSGGDGDDLLIGGEGIFGTEVLDGGAESDMLVVRGSAGNSENSNLVLRGGAGNDLYLSNATDVDADSGPVIEFRAGDGHDEVLYSDVNGASNDTNLLRIDMTTFSNADIRVIWNATPTGQPSSADRVHYAGDVAVVVKSTGDSILFRNVGGELGVGSTYRQIDLPVHIDLAGDGAFTGSLIFADGWSNVDWNLGDTSPYDHALADYNGSLNLGQETGTAGDDEFSGTAGSDSLDGGAGNDTFEASAGDDVINGGDGDDALNIFGRISDFVVESSGQGGVKLTDSRDGSITTATNIEEFFFVHEDRSWSWASAPTLVTDYEAVGLNGPYVSFDLSGSFFDEDNDLLSYGATLSDGSSLPEWMYLSGSELNAEVPENYADTIELTVWASDGMNMVSDTFQLYLENYV